MSHYQKMFFQYIIWERPVWEYDMDTFCHNSIGIYFKKRLIDNLSSWYHGEITWALRFPISPENQPFVQQFVHVDIKENIKAEHCFPFVRVIYLWQVDSPNKGLIMQKVFLCHVMIMKFFMTTRFSSSSKFYFQQKIFNDKTITEIYGKYQ